MNWIKRKFEMLHRFFYWGWKLRNSYDWDFGYLYEIIWAKLDKMQKNMLQYGNCVWNDSPDTNLMRKLRTCTELARRLYEEDYGSFERNKHYEKWGKPKMISGEPNERGLSEITIMTEKATTDELKAQEYKELKKIFQKEADARNRDKQMLFNLLNKYSDYFWD